MKQKPLALPLLLFFLGHLPLAAGKVFSQEQDSILDKILRPLPVYDPFDKPPPSDQFFPDEVHRRVRAALTDALTGREGAPEEHARFFMNRDRELMKERGSVTGLTEQVSDLATNTIRDRQRYLQAQRRLLASSPSPNQRKLIEARLRNDELSQAEELVRKSTANRWGGALNRLLGSVDLISILTGSYIGAAVDSAVSQWAAGDWGGISIEDRKALTLYREHLKRYPDDPQNGEVQKRVEVLETKRNRVLLRKQTTLAQEALGKGETGVAELHYAIAGFLDPSAREVEEGVKQLRERSRQQEEDRKRALLAATRERTPLREPQGGEGTRTTNPADDGAARELLYALSLRKPERIEAHAKALEEAYRGKGMAESARDARAVALEIKGQHEEAKKLLKEIADSSLDPREKKRAKLLTENPDYNLLDSFREARSQRRLETVKYVLLGDDFLKKNLLYGTAPLVASGPAGAGSVAAANVIMIGTNLYEALTSNPISHQSVIDKGEAYIRSHPQSESASEVYEILAEAYEEMGLYDKAIAYHKMSGKAPEKKIADVNEKAAKALLQASAKSGERGAEEAYLRKILVDYPESAAAKEAAGKLAVLAKRETQGLRMSKKFLMENPELYGPEGLSLKPALFDGNLNNMELADEGVNLLSEREILLRFKSPWGLQSQAYPIDKQASERFQATLRRRNYEIAMGDVDKRAKGSPGGIDGLPAPLLRGELDKKEAEAGEAAMTLVREATVPSPDSPRVLHHQLLSKTEKESGKQWKLPSIQGSLSASRFDMSGSLPADLSQNRLSIGADEKSPYAGLELPIPLLQGFIPVDFLIQGRPGRFSLFPRIHLYKDQVHDKELYR